MSGSRTPPPFPRAPLFGAAALILFILLIAVVSRFTGIGAVFVETAKPVESRVLRFADQPDGSLVVLEAASGEIIETFAPGTNGFVRSVMRGLARERKMTGFDHQAPFKLIRWDDNRLSLYDTATGRQIELVSFGVTQLEVFVSLLRADSESQPNSVQAFRAKKLNQ